MPVECMLEQSKIFLGKPLCILMTSRVNNATANKPRAHFNNSHLLLGRGAANVEEVCGRAAVHLDDVHGGHSEARAVDHAANATVEADVVQVVLLAHDLHARAR